MMNADITLGARGVRAGSRERIENEGGGVNGNGAEVIGKSREESKAPGKRRQQCPSC